jgi:signal transduction histidine kinase/ligand-binding sensor domain-containing protein
LDPSLDVSQYAHTAWKIREGFIKGTIFSMAQTSDGYLWLGTEAGLYRFDGVQPIPWQPPHDEQLPDNFVHQLLVARDGTLWIGTDKGLASLKNGELTQYPEVADQRIDELLQDADGAIWFGAMRPGRLCAVRAVRTQCYGAGSFGASISALYEDHKGSLWVSATTGLWRWAPGTPEHYTLPGEGTQAHALLEDGNGALLMATKSSSFLGPVNDGLEGLKQLVDGRILRYTLPVIGGHFRPLHLFKSSDGSLWIGTVQGLLHVHQGRIDRFSASDGLSGDIAGCFFEDREGDIWVATSTGLDRFRDFAIPTISLSQGLSIAAVGVLEATPDGSIWIATADGLNRWQEGHMTIYGKRPVPDRSGPTNERERIIDARVTEIGNSGLVSTGYSLGQDGRGQLWAGTSEGVFYFDRGRFVPVPGLAGGQISSIAGDGPGKVWISNNHALFYWTPEGGVGSIPWARFGNKHAAVALLPDRLQGGLWLGFFDGGIAYLKDGQIRSSYSHADGLGTGSVMDLQPGSDGAVWAGTEGGLSRVKDGRVTTLNSRNGLPCDAVQWAMEDNDRSFWLSMPCGLVRIARTEWNAWVSDSKRSIRTTVFDASDGVWSRGRFGRYTRHVAKSPDGKIWFSPPDGVSVIDPQHLRLNKLPPPVYVKQVTANATRFDASQGLRLPALVRDLEIDYTALSLVAPEKVHFRYKLEGRDHDWKEVVNERKAFYTDLPPRHYRFHVIACNNSGVWNETGDTLDFSIAPAYYQTTWFLALCVAAFLTVLWTIYRLRVGVLEERQRLSEQHQGEISALNERLMKAQEEERIRIAGELHDGVLQRITSLTLRLGTAIIKLPADSEVKNRIRESQKDLMQVGTEIRHLSHELHPAVLQESGLPSALCFYCEEFSKVRGIPVSCEVDESVADLSPGAALCLYRIAQEALGNVAKHAQAKQADVRLSRSDGNVSLSVSDDGIGFTPGGKSRGLGLINMRERVYQLHGTFEVHSEPGRGTEIKAAIPFRPLT